MTNLPDDDDEPKKTSKATIIRRVLVFALALACAGGWIYTRYLVKKEPLGGVCTYDMHCQKEAPRCMKQDVEGDGVCTRPCDDDSECAADIKCIKVQLDDYDERGRPLEGGYCFPQALLDARKAKKRGDAGAAAAKSDSWLDVPANPDQLEGEITVERGSTKTTVEVKGTLLRVVGAKHGRTIVDTSTLRVYQVDDDKKTFAASQLGGGGDAKVTKTDKKDKVADRECDIWQIEEGKTMREACVVKGGSFVDPSGRAVAAWEKELTVRAVFPLRITENDKTKLQVTKLDAHPVDAAGFTIPKSYKNLAQH
ncbi:MAG: hypothetical protein KIT84_20390 [Labilithrix sp.]|nr:hypothetical protein [Labilithrix sp.]MCW5813399.1 hypothetical protein [Labilithrix sp.]